MSQIIIEGLDDELGETIRRLAERQGRSPNQMALELLKMGAALSQTDPKAPNVGASLDRFIGSWSMEEAAELDAALQDFERVDETAW